MATPDTDGYRRFLEDVDRREMSNADTYDKSLLSLSSAFLGITLTFTQNVVPIETAKCISLLLASWVLFSLTIIVVLGSFIYGQSAIRTLKTMARAFYLDGDLTLNENSEKISTRIFVLNSVTGLLFILAVLSFTTYIGLNVTEAARMTNQRESGRTERSQPLPNLQQHQTPPAAPPASQAPSQPQSETGKK
jgi:hypothetical protein